MLGEFPLSALQLNKAAVNRWGFKQKIKQLLCAFREKGSCLFLLFVSSASLRPDTEAWLLCCHFLKSCIKFVMEDISKYAVKKYKTEFGDILTSPTMDSAQSHIVLEMSAGAWIHVPCWIDGKYPLWLPFAGRQLVSICPMCFLWVLQVVIVVITSSSEFKSVWSKLDGWRTYTQ